MASASTLLLGLFAGILAASPPSINPITPPAILLCSQPTGLIQDASCHFETIDELNRRLHSQLNHAVQLPIFRYHKVDLYRQCPFWYEDGACGNRACAVDELDKDDVPQYWRAKELSNLKTTDRTQLPSLMPNDDKPCGPSDSDYCVLDDSLPEPSNGVYVDLLANPERFTGYAGPSAWRIWAAIYEENCFDLIPPSTAQDTFPPSSLTTPKAFVNPLWGGPARVDHRSGLGPDLTCLEKRVYYKLLSGLHTSISIHICDEYLDPVTGQWVPNLQCYLTRVGAHPDRLRNLYFAYTLMLRALSKSSAYLRSEGVELCTDNEQADRETRRVLDQLIDTAQAYPGTFDEKSMFKNKEAKTLKEEFKMHFRNVSRIMDCVGCDKCRLWGKLQVTGLGTALKLLFEYEEGDNDLKKNFHLSRSELIAFINTLHRLSESLEAVGKFRRLWERRNEDGTLPHEEVDERLDSAISGLAASAIELRPGLGPRAGPDPVSHHWKVNGTLVAKEEEEKFTTSRGDLIGQQDTRDNGEATNVTYQDNDMPLFNRVAKSMEEAPPQAVADVLKPESISSPIAEDHVNVVTSSSATPQPQLQSIYKNSARASSSYDTARQEQELFNGTTNRRNTFDIFLTDSANLIKSTKFLRILAQRCKRSCVNWIDDAAGHIKRLVMKNNQVNTVNGRGKQSSAGKAEL